MWKSRNSQKGLICMCGCTSSYTQRSYTAVRFLSFKRPTSSSPHKILFTHNQMKALVAIQEKKYIFVMTGSILRKRPGSCD